MPGLERIREIHLVLTASCNLACSYCYQNAKWGGRMSWETLSSAVDLLLTSDEPQVTLTFYGGEPLLEFELVERAVECVEARCRPEQSVKYAIVTNGILMGEREARFLAEHRFETTLSFDGTAFAQALRGGETFAVLDGLLDRLRADHREWFERDLAVGMTLLPSTVSYLADGVRYFLSKGVGEIALSVLATDSSDWQIDQIDELDVQAHEVFEASLEHYDETGRIPLAFFRRGDEKPRERSLRPVCGVGRGRTLTVDLDGQVYGCVMFAESYQKFPSDFLGQRLGAMRLGHVSDPQLAERLAAYPEATRQAEIFDHLEEKYSAYGRCSECEYLSTCSFCPVSIGHQPGNTDPRRVPDFLCAFNLVFGKYRDQFPVLPNPFEVLSALPDDTPADEKLQAFNDAASALGL